MAPRKSIPMQELRERAEEKSDAGKHVTDYDPDRGGWFPPSDTSGEPE